MPTRSGDVRDDDLVALYDATPDDAPFVRLNMVSTLDGAGVGPDGRSGSINTPADHEIFALLRAWADVILVGAGTARAEEYGPARTAPRWTSRRNGRAADPAIAVVTRSGRLPEPLADAETGEVLLVTAGQADATELDRGTSALGADHVLQHDSDEVDLAATVRWLQQRGLRRVLCEGGPSLAADLVGGDLVDELCLTWSPRLVGGSAGRILHGEQLAGRGTLQSLLHEDGTLIGRWDLRAGMTS
ncbi:dihydrofolate reductase family protein [Luteipulveratus sp. YIM 133132]|uniref:dihydrofolate reductase family protein n=1 Tax=Luteipulveratus flavus TaxID=3031728 RepID=UPI0023B10408|nr:dihydrofolate reductase family protein [Luteipulveratus sp. YIM 133132]MDE9364460.1 dihydrofolate reductase family protein [Luteipulveratus sp. YIM 133132]